jgi:membrane protease YdiL (CAAX protease family)
MHACASKGSAMTLRVVGILFCALFVLWVHAGEYPTAPVPRRRRGREVAESLLLAAGLLVVPHLELQLFWLPDWLGVYLLYGLGAVLALGIFVRRRTLLQLGIAKPKDRRVIGTVGWILAMIALSKIVDPLQVAAGHYQAVRRSLAAIVIFPALEEAIFRGLLQTRLEAVMGTVRAWLMAGAFFGFYHYYVNHLLPMRPITPESALSLVYLVVLGMLLGAIFAKTRSLLPPFMVHAMNNIAL